MVVAVAAAIGSLAACATASAETATTGGAVYGEPPQTVPGSIGKLSADGRTAIAPADAPEPVKQAIAAANSITDKPYRYGGGHKRFDDTGYDCSGAISFALRGGALLKSPLDSSSFMRWGERGRGAWITIYTNPGHAYLMIAGLRFDTSGSGGKGPRWRAEKRSTRGFRARHPLGL